MLVIPALGRLRKDDQEFIPKKRKKKKWTKRQIIEMTQLFF